MPKSDYQKIKLFHIADYLMRETDADDKGNMLHGAYLYEIKDYLETIGITAEEHAIRRDIDLLRGVKIEDGEEKRINRYVLDIRGGKGKPVYIGKRFLPFDELEIIAECVASANFISRPEAEDLIEKLKRFCSKHQAETLTSEYVIVERPKYTEKAMIKYLRTIKAAIRNNQKVSFRYTRHSPKNITQTENRKKGRYIVSPFRVVLSDGNHYLICFDDTYHQIRAYRIDRMDDVRILEAPIDGKDKFDRLGIKDYAKQTFGMFIGGKANYITLRFENSLLDTMLERFPKGGGTTYKPIDDKHFTVKTFIVESENFYGWVCGLGERVVIQDPPETAERFKDYLQQIADNYR